MAHQHCECCAQPFPEDGTLEACAMKHILAASKDAVGYRFRKKGTMEAALKQASVVSWQTVLHPHLCNCCQALDRPTKKILNVTETMFSTGITHRGEKSHEMMDADTIAGNDVARKIRADCYDKWRVYQFFHSHDEGNLPDYSENIELDKSKRNEWTKKTMEFPPHSKKRINLTCQPRYRRATKGALAREYLDSETHKSYLRMPGNDNKSISAAEIQLCICDCISPENVSECACPTCTDIECELKALRQNLSCCSDEGCRMWKQAIRSTDTWARCLSCEDEELEGQKRHQSTEQFAMRPLRCCLALSDNSYLKPCQQCTFATKLPIPSCDCFSKEALSKTVTWLKRQPTIEGHEENSRIVTRLRQHKGLLSELLDSIKSKTKPYLHHMWRSRFLRHAFHLDCDEFIPEKEVVMLADFASQMVLGSGYKSTCETDATCNLYVVLVLYKKPIGDGRYETICDYVRFWSPAKSGPEFHHHAIHIITNHLKLSKVPGLIRIRLWTDGHASTYKGFPNFGRMAFWPRTKLANEVQKPGWEDAEGVEIIHCFFESYHASGVQDSAGKDPRIAMTRAIGFKAESLYNYHECKVWCDTHMQAPIKKKKAKPGAHFIASGDYLWYALSDGFDAHKETYPNLDLRRKEYTPVPGSDSMFEFSALFNEENTPQILSRTLPCRCEVCRAHFAGNSLTITCPHLLMTGGFTVHKMVHKKTFSLKESLDRKAEKKKARALKVQQEVAKLSSSTSTLPVNQVVSRIVDTTSQLPRNQALALTDALLVAHNEDTELVNQSIASISTENDFEANLEVEQELSTEH